MDDLLFILSLSLKLFTLYFAAVAVFTLCRRRKYPRTAPRTKFAVVVAARNEEAVIGNLVHSVLTQDYPASCLLYTSSDYFEKMYECAVSLIKKGLAYVCELTPEQMKEMRGDVNCPAQCPYRAVSYTHLQHGGWKPFCLPAALAHVRGQRYRTELLYLRSGWKQPLCPAGRGPAGDQPEHRAAPQ